jgi:hypothetical protein
MLGSLRKMDSVVVKAEYTVSCLLLEASERNLLDCAFVRRRKIRKINTPMTKRNTREPSTPETILIVFEDVVGGVCCVVVELADTVGEATS